LKQTRRDPAQGPPESATTLLADQRAKTLGAFGALQEQWAMKLFSGWVIPAGLVLMAGSANAQMLAPYDAGRSPYTAVSDFDGPYAAMPPEEAPPRAGPMLLPAREVYTVVRESGFSPVGTPQRRGPFYTIAVIDRAGVDGWLVIDARDGQIVRRMPGDRMGDNANGEYGAAGPLPPVSSVRGPPRPPASIPRVASRTPSVPIPKAAPLRSVEEPKSLAAKPAPEPVQPSQAAQPAQPQQSAAAQVKPSAAETTPQAAPAPAEATPAEVKPTTSPIQPTQEMPKVQGLE
jgi:hypothetical protein